MRGDGNGYPQRLADKQISLQQGVLQVGDVVSALVNKRSYREAASKQQVLRFLNDEVEKSVSRGSRLWCWWNPMMR